MIIVTEYRENEHPSGVGHNIFETGRKGMYFISFT